MAELKELIEKAEGMEGWMAAAYTDRYEISDWNPENIGNPDYLLDLRVFNKEKEFHLFRPSVADHFILREKPDEKDSDFFDEVQLLDIDTVISKDLFEKEGKLQSVTGGTYKFPVSVVEKNGIDDLGIVIRHYIDKYDNTGRAYEKDFRCVCFKKVKVIANILEEERRND